VGCVLLEIFSRYARYVEILKWTTLSLLSYVATALVVDVPWREVAYHTFVPSFIWQKDYIVTIVAVLGTTITPYCFFWQSSQEAEDERIDSAAHPLLEAPEEASAEIGRIRLDTYLGMGLSNLISLFIIVTTAATLHANTGLCARRGIGVDDRTRSATSQGEGILRHHRGGDGRRHLDQFRRYRPDQGLVLGRGAERCCGSAVNGRDHDHGLAGGHCRGPHGPNVPRAFASLLGSGHNADDSSMPLHREDGPSVPGPTCNGDQPVPNIHPPRRSLDLDAVPTPHSGSGVAGFRCTPQSVLNSARQ